jgi:deoxycytidylate deaminase
MILKIRAERGEKTHQAVEGGKPVKPDGKHRVYILDSLRHPAEVALLRHIYQDAFILIGVVCEEEKRIERLGKKCKDAGRENALEFMKRDADAKEKHGQHVEDTFHLSDFFVDHSMDRTNRDGSSNRLWEINDHLARLVRILTHSSLERPSIAETAMHHASSAQLRSACLSRQVGAALVDRDGNIVATGTNEAPRAGGGVYGEQFRDQEDEGKNEVDYRCAYFEKTGDRYCRNSRTQLEIIKHLIADIPVLAKVPLEDQPALIDKLRKTELGALIEFSRAVHAEMDALLTAARKGVSIVGTRLFVTTFPCHYCARHLVAAGVDEVQFIEAYPKSRAIPLHRDSIQLDGVDWKAPSKGGTKVLIHPFSGVAPRLYKRAFTKDRELKDKLTGEMNMQVPDWGTPWHLRSIGYPEMEAALAEEITSKAEEAGKE